MVEGFFEQVRAYGQVQHCNSASQKVRQPKTLSQPFARDSDFLGFNWSARIAQHRFEFGERQQLLAQSFFQAWPYPTQLLQLVAQLIPSDPFRSTLLKRNHSQIALTESLRYQFLQSDFIRPG